MILLRNFLNIFHIADLRRKVFFTLAVLIVYRLGNHIPVIGALLLLASAGLASTGERAQSESLQTGLIP